MTKQFQLKITLAESDPPIWRRLQCLDYPLYNIHELIQVAMGWERCHLFRFDIDGRKYEDEESHGEVRRVKLSDVVHDVGAVFKYIYDFGDWWVHEVAVESIDEPPEDAPGAICLAGGHACPPEDVGGVPGYEGFLAAINDPTHHMHKDMMDWVDGHFDPDTFDIDAVNQVFAQLSSHRQ